MAIGIKVFDFYRAYVYYMFAASCMNGYLPHNVAMRKTSIAYRIGRGDKIPLTFQIMDHILYLTEYTSISPIFWQFFPSPKNPGLQEQL